MPKVELIKPTRTPDYLSPYGGAYWFDELIYLNNRSELHKINVDRHFRLICDDIVKRECGRCRNCLEGEPCERNYFASHVQLEYRKWLDNAFEKHLLPEDKDGSQ